MSKRNAGMRHWMWLSGAVVGLSAGSALAGMVGPQLTRALLTGEDAD